MAAAEETWKENKDKQKGKKGNNFLVEDLVLEDEIEFDENNGGDDGKKDMVIYNNSKHEPEFVKFLEENKIDENDLEVALVENISLNEKNLCGKLKELLEVLMSENSDEIKNQAVLVMAEYGCDLSVLGILSFKDRHGNVIYSTDLKNISENFVEDLIIEMSDTSFAVDDTTSDPKLKTFLGSNWESVLNEEREKLPAWLRDEDEGGEDVEPEEKNSLPTELGDKGENNESVNGENDWRTTRVLGLDVIQRINYATGDGEVEIPTVDENGEVTGTQKIKESDLTLNLLEHDKEGKVFNALARHFWKELAMHGKVVVNEDGEKKIKVQGDLDVKLSIEVLKMAGIKVDLNGIKFVEPGDEVQGSVNVDTSKEREDPYGEEGETKKFDGVNTILEEVVVDGKTQWKVTLIVDHHSKTSKSDSSAAKQLYEGLFKLGLIEKVDPDFVKLIEFSALEDNGISPVEMEVVRKKYNEDKNVNLGKREFFFRKWSQTAWSQRRGVDSTGNWLKYIKSGGTFVEILGDRINKKSKKEFADKNSELLSNLGLIYGNKNSIEFVAENLRSTVEELQKIEKNNGVLETTKYGQVVIDDGKKMLVGSQACRDLGYGGYVSYDRENGSFMIWTKEVLTDDFKQGFKLREHMWIYKPKEGENLDVSLEQIMKTLSGGDDLKFSNGLYGSDKLENIADFKKVKVEKKAEELTKKESVMNKDTYKQLYVGGYSPDSADGKKALEELKTKGMDLVEALRLKRDISTLNDAVLTLHRNKPYGIFSSKEGVKEAEEFIKSYFGVVEGEEKKVEEKVVESEPELKKEEKRPERLEESELFGRFEALAERFKHLDLWKGWLKRLGTISSEERINAITQLQATLYLLDNPLERLNHADYWRETAMDILRDLGVTEV